MATEFKLPELGENIETAEVSRLLVKEGDTIESLSALYKVDTQSIVEANDLPDPNLVIGQALIHGAFRGHDDALDSVGVVGTAPQDSATFSHANDTCERALGARGVAVDR